jgi:hypothetical protein
LEPRPHLRLVVDCARQALTAPNALDNYLFLTGCLI